MTFDDGPSPDSAVILDELHHMGVQATFFVVAERACNWPEVLRRMIDEGHEIGVHALRHVSAFALTPWRTVQEIGQAIEQIERLTGQRPRYYRPPWGHVNLGTLRAIRRFGLVPVFWTIAPNDWRKGKAAEWISHYVVQLSQPGSVIVLHDAGGPRQRTAKALRSMITGLRALGLEPGTVGSMPPDHSMLRRVWTWWEIRFTRGWDIDTVPSRTGGEPLLRLGHIWYRGARVHLKDGLVLKPGDPMGEIHFGNPALSQMSGRATSGIRALHGVLGALTDLAQMVDRNPKYQHIKVVGGVTLLDAAKAIERLGFQRQPVRGWTKWSMWFYLVFLMAIYHRDGWRTLKRFRHLAPVMVLMSRHDLIDRYAHAKPRRR